MAKHSARLRVDIGVKTKIPDIRSIMWIDSSLQNGQVDKDDYPTPTMIVSVGFVIDETKEYVTIARDGMTHGDYRGICSIPKVSIKSMYTIRSF